MNDISVIRKKAYAYIREGVLKAILPQRPYPHKGYRYLN